jgi:hypothetical protein
MTRFLLTFFALFLLTATPALAASINEEGAAVLKKEVEEGLTHYQKMALAQGNEIKMSGPVTVIAKDKLYEVKLQGLEVASGPMVVKIGNVTIHAVPGKAGEYMTSMALPAKILVHDAMEKKDIAQVTIGKQKFSGVWHPELRMYSQVDAGYDQIEIKGLNETTTSFNITVVKSIIRMKITPDAGADTWSGASFAEMAGLSLKGHGPTTKKLSIDIEKFIVKSFMGKLDMKAIRDISEKTIALLKDKKIEDISIKEKSALLTEILKSSTAPMDSEKYATEISNIHFTRIPADGRAEKPVSVSIAQINSLFDATDLKKDKSNANTNFNVKGISYKNAPPLIAGLIPSEANIVVSVNGLPIKAIKDVVNQAAIGAIASQGLSDPVERQKAEAAEDAKLLTLLGVLERSGASITVRDTYIRSADMTSFLDGKMSVQAAALSPIGIPAVGNLTLVLEGLDETVIKYQTMSGDNPEIMNSLQAFAMLQLMGKEGRAANGKSTRTYRLDITPEGQILMNGQDLSAMAGMMGGGMGGMGR